MIITDLNHIEVVDASNVEGGLAFADANAKAKAKGREFAATYAFTYTSAYSGYYYNSAKSVSGSSSTAG